MSRHEIDPDGSCPVLARVAGLPARAVEQFSSRLADELPVLFHLEDELSAARSELADRLHSAVPSATPETRRLLLAVKRDCHNRRPLAAHRADPLWSAVREVAEDCADRVPELEAAVAEHRARFRAAHQVERDRQRRLLAAHLDDTVFLRGLALSSPDLIHAGRKLARTPPDRHGRREERAELALLRYVTRAATKLSPFSTFTAVALGTVGPAPAPLRFHPGEPRVRSLVRANRYVLDQYYWMLTLYPPFRDGLRVVANSSAVEVAPGSFQLLRPAQWGWDEGTERWVHHKDALVKMDLRSPLVERAAGRAAAERPTYGELLAVLEDDPGGADVRGRLDQLLGAGFLLLELPWAVGEAHLETALLRRLRTLPADPPLDHFTGLLEELVRLEETFASAADPAGTASAADRLLDDLWRAAARLAGLPETARWDRFRDDDVYEDVLLLPGDGAGSATGVFHLARASADEALRSVMPLARYTALFDHRHEFLHSLAAFAHTRWSGRTEVGVLELFQAAGPLWRDFLRFHLGSRGGAAWSSTWNPLALPELEALARWRAEILAALPGCLVPADGEQLVDGSALDALLNRVPSRYTTVDAGTSLFIQPATADGSLWMLNRMKEGTGRFGSRYTPAMDGATRRQYTAHLAARGIYTVDGEPAALLDLHCTQGDNLNVHAIQTPAVLTFPGQEEGVPEHRRVRLRDLRVRFGGPGVKPTLRGPGGERYLAVHLGVAYEDCMPTLIKFLLPFGPSELNPAFPSQWVRREGDGAVAERTRLGSIVLHRRSWTFPVAALAAEIGEMDDAGAFATVHRWRSARGIPDRVFVPEWKPHPLIERSYKPQYLDFTSPLFVPLFRAMLAAVGDSLTFSEMLPTPDLFPIDGAGERRAVELLLDPLPLRPAHTAGPVVPPRVRHGRREPAPAGG